MKHEINFSPVLQTSAAWLEGMASIVHAYPLQVIAWCSLLMAARSVLYRSRT